MKRITYSQVLAGLCAVGGLVLIVMAQVGLGLLAIALGIVILALPARTRR